MWGGGGNHVVPPPCGDPWELDSIMLSVRHGTHGLTTCGVPVLQKRKQPVNNTVRSSTRKNVSLFHAKLKTRLTCWNVRTLGCLSEQSDKLLGLVRTMQEKKIELMALSETRWTGQGVKRIKDKNFLYSGTEKERNYGVAIALSSLGRRSWEEQVVFFIQCQSASLEPGLRPILVMHSSLPFMPQLIQPMPVKRQCRMSFTSSFKPLLQ